MIDPVLFWVTNLCLAVLWLSAALGKWKAQQEFQQILRNYQLLTPTILPVLAFVLPPVELLLALGLVIPQTHSIAAFATAVLLLLYAMAMAVNLMRGRIYIDCGCSLGHKQAISWWLVLRNCVLVVFSLSLLLPIAQRQWQLPDLLVTLLVTVFICVAYPLVYMIIGNMNSLKSGVQQ